MDSPITDASARKWREGKVRPIPGNSPHDRPVSRGILPSSRRVCDDPFLATCFPAATKILRRLSMRFSRHGGIYLVRCGFNVKQLKTKPWGGTVPPPAGRPRAQVKERAGRTTLLLIVRR